MKNGKGKLKSYRGFYFCLAVFTFSFLLFHFVFAASLTFIRDTIGTSAPSLPATHEIQFTATNAIPPGGKIVIVPEPGAFIIPAAFNFLDADLAVATSSVYADRALLGAPSATDDGMTVVSGSSGSFTFTLNGTAGINAGEKVRIEFGNNATFAATGTNFIINPTPAVSYRIGIRTENASGGQIDSGTAMIVVILPVTGGPVNTTMNPPVISNGLPAGLLPSGTVAVDLSVRTDIPATCKYSTVPDTSFASSTGAFIFTGGIVHSGAVITGLVNGTTYSFYVRCRNFQLLANTTDYIISFSIGVVSVPPPPPPPLSSGGASGGPSGGGDFLKTADVVISGTSYPSSKVFILKDGKEAASATASGGGAWNAKISGLERGTYTFGVYAIDSKNKRSATVSSTVWALAGTINTVTRILLPPTLRAEKTSVDPGRPFMISGQGIPNSITEISLFRQGKSGGGAERAASTTVDTKGDWNAGFDTRGLSTGSYEARAKSLPSDGGSSGFGSALLLGIGQDAAPDLAARSDLNKDGKVNLIDFSILLFSWGTDNVAADLNGNGTVDLADFSILIFYWTG